MGLQNGLVLTQGLQSITLWIQIYEVRRGIRSSLGGTVDFIQLQGTI